MSAKLTLTIDKMVIEKAKKYAKSQGRSLSNLVEEYLKSVSQPDKQTEQLELSPIVRALYGAVQWNEKDPDYKQILEDEILKKHLR